MKLELFSTPFFMGNIDLKKIKLDAKMGEAFVSKTPTSISKDPEKNILDPESGKYLISIIIDLLREKYQYFSIRLLDIWRNKYLNMDFQEPHIHLRSKFSFIIYEEVGEITHTIFYNPAKYLLYATLGSDQKCMLQQFTPQVRKGQIIVFPSYVEHMVNRNSDQVTISGNLDIDFTLPKEEIEEQRKKKKR
jgi:hypothetical protein